MVADEIKKWVANWVNNLFFERARHQQVSAGVASAGQPIVLDREGKIDNSFIDADSLLQDADIDVDSIKIDQDGTTGNALRVYRNLPSTSTDSPVLAVIQDHASDDQVAFVVRQDGSGNIVNLYDGAGVAVAVVTVAGKVGIGTAAPYSALHIQGTPVPNSDAAPTADFLVVENNGGSTYINIIGPATSNAGVLFSDDQRAMGYIAYSHATNSLNFYVNTPVVGTARVTIDSAGALTVAEVVNAQGGVTVTGGDLMASNVGIVQSNHPQLHTFRQYVIPGYYVSTTRMNLVAFTVSAYQGVTVRISYGQYNGDSATELYMSMGCLTITHDNSNFWVVSTPQYLSTQHITLAVQTNTSNRCMVYLTKTTGISFRPETNWRCASIEIIGLVSAVTLNPTTL